MREPCFAALQISHYIQWYQTREYFFGFSVCSHVYLLNYRSELAQIWRQDTDTIHDHNHIKKNISMQVRPAIMGVMVGWFWGHKSKLCLEQIWHIFFARGLQFIMHLRFGPDFTVQPSPVLWYKVSPHKCQLKLGFSLFSKCLEQICHAVMIQLGAERQSFMSPQS